MKTSKSTPTPRDGEVDAIALLKSHHRDVEHLFAKIVATTERAEKLRRTLFGELATKIEAHAQIEEQHFYPEGRAVDKDMTLEAYEEHSCVRELIVRIKSTEPTDESYLAKVTVLKELIEHHVEEEENEYFPKVQKALGKDKLLELGATMQEQFDAMVAGEPVEAEEAPLLAKPTGKKSSGRALHA